MRNILIHILKQIAKIFRQIQFNTMSKISNSIANILFQELTIIKHKVIKMTSIFSFFTFLVLILFSTLVEAQWQRQTNGLPDTWNLGWAIDASDSNNAIISTSVGLFKTTDGGINWIQQTNLNIWQSRDVYFLNTSKGFIIDGLFDLLKTTNSGNIWFNQLNSQYVIRSFGWLSPLHGLIIGDGIYESNDSGNTWQEIIELRNIGLRKLHSPKNYLGYSIGNLGLIYKYIDTTIVPVELVSFAGSIIDGKVQLEWNTATELNNLGFEIQKSNDKENWINIGFVEGRGTSSEKNYYNFQDNNIVSTKNYYRLKQIDFDGIFCYSEITEVSFPIDNYYLSQNYPNPFNPASLIQFGISDPSKVKIVLFDVAGQEVKTLIDKEYDIGIYSIQILANDLSSGVYFYKMTTNSGFTATKKLTIIK